MDEEIGTKVRQGLLNSVSVGLRVDDFKDVELEGRMLRKLHGITVKELSIVLFPAVEGATFEPSFEFSEVVESSDIMTTKSEPINIALVEELLVNQGKMVVDSVEFQQVLDQLEDVKMEHDRMVKRLWLHQNCDHNFIEEMTPRVTQLSLDQMQALYRVYEDLQSHVSSLRCVVADETLNNSADTIKEDIRELIFKKRRDSKPIGSIKDLRNGKST